MTRSRKLVEREVRVDDPDLSPEANRLMTGELRPPQTTQRGVGHRDTLGD